MRIFIIGIFISFPFLFFSQIPTAGLIGGWPFSGNANDISINANHGTVHGATLVPDRCGVPNSAYSFNGTSDYIIMLLGGPTGTVSRSISFWARTNYTITGSPKATFEFGGNLGPGTCYEIVWNYCGAGVGLDVGNQALIRGNNCLLNNAWHHIASVYDATTSTVYSTVKFYIDGVLQPVISCNVSGTNATINSMALAPVTIGKNANSASRYWNGELDDFYFYDRALTPAEVMQLYTFTTCPIPIIGNATVCPGSTNVYSVSPISNATYTWSLPGGWSGTSSTNTISTIAGASSGIITVAASSTCGSFGTSTLAVTSQTVPLLTISTTNSLLCSGSTSTLTGAGATSYTWLPGGSNNSAITFTPLTTSIYTLSGIAANGCTANMAFTQTVVNSATIIGTAPPSLCSGAAVTLSATGANSYTWQPGNLTGSLITVSPLTTSFYTVVGTSAATCTGSAIVLVSVPSALTLNIAASSPTACLGAAITFTANAAGGVPGYNYTWSGGPSTATKVVNPSVGGTYVYTVTAVDANTCSITQTTSVDFAPGFTLNSSSTAICPGSVQTLTIAGVNAYTWNPGGFVGNAYTVSPASMSVYTVIGTSALGCTASATQTVTIKPSPTFSFFTAAITCASLGSATVTASGTPGPFSYTWSPTLQTGSNAAGLYPGTYSVSVSDAGTGCAFTPTTYFPPLVPLTGTLSATASLVCHGINTATAGIALAGGSGTQSYLWSDVNGTQTTAIASSLASGINTVNVIDGVTFCSVTHTFLVTQPSAFTLNIASSSPSVCMGGSITYSATNSGGTPGYSYTWTNGPSTTTFVVNESVPATYIYTVTSTDANACTVTNTVSGKFVINPVVSVSNASICPLAIASLTAFGALSYSWSNGSLTNPTAVSPTTSIQYTVTGATAGCTASAIAEVIIKPAPVATFTSNAPVCQGDSLALSSVNTHSLYYWSGPLSFSSSASSVLIHSVTPAMSGNYTLKVTAANSCTNSVTNLIIVNPTPSLAAFANTVCEGHALNLSSGYLAGASYLWTGPAYSSTLQNPSRPNSDPSMSGQYSINITSAAGCTNYATVSASVIPLPIPVITINNNFCVGSPVILNGSGGGTYSWFGPNNFNSTLQNPVIPNAVMATGGTYSLYVYTGACYAMTSKLITINALPVFTVTSNSPVCEHAIISLSTNASVVSYTWSGPNGFTTNTPNALIYFVSVSQSGMYTLSATDGNSCTGFSSTYISILPAPISVVKNATVCLGAGITLTTNTSGGINYSWSGPQNYSSTLQAAYIPVVNINNTGIYTLVVVGSNSCSTSSTLNLTGLSIPLPIPAISALPKACINSTLNLHGSGGISYLWQGPGNFTSTTKDISLSITGYNLSGTYTLSVKNESNCIASTTVLVTVYPMPQGNLLSSHNNECVPFCTRLQFKEQTNISPVVSSLFSINSDVLKDSLTSYCFNRAGNYYASVSFRDTNNCINTSTLLIAVNPKPVADFEHKPLNPIAGIDAVQFFNTTGGEGLGSWNWFLLGNDSIAIDDKDPSHLYETAGQYPIILIAKNKWTCSDTVIKILVVEDEYGLYVPNAFTPNGDGLNDIFQPKGQGIAKYSLEIYTRWGERIFYTTNFDEGWDGTFRGKQCETSTYVWKINVTGEQKQNKNYTGQITLLRARVKEPD